MGEGPEEGVKANGGSGRRIGGGKCGGGGGAFLSVAVGRRPK